MGLCPPVCGSPGLTQALAPCPPDLRRARPTTGRTCPLQAPAPQPRSGASGELPALAAPGKPGWDAPLRWGPAAGSPVLGDKRRCSRSGAETPPPGRCGSRAGPGRHSSGRAPDCRAEPALAPGPQRGRPQPRAQSSLSARLGRPGGLPCSDAPGSPGLSRPSTGQQGGWHAVQTTGPWAP